MVETQKLDGFWVHLDVNVLSDDLMPALDSRQAGGLSYAALGMFVQALLPNPRAIGLEITILDPDLDPTGGDTRRHLSRGLPDDPGR